jgi:hypothetical protein
MQEAYKMEMEELKGGRVDVEHIIYRGTSITTCDFQ